MKFEKKKMLPLLINIMPRTHYCGIFFFILTEMLVADHSKAL